MEKILCKSFLPSAGVASLQRKVFGTLLSPTQPGRLCFEFSQHRHPSCPIPPSLPPSDTPFVPLSWLMLENLHASPWVRVSILLACGGLCLCRPLSRPPVLFPPQTMCCCHSAVRPGIPSGQPYNLLGGHESGEPLKRMWSQTEQVQMQAVSH